MLRFIEPAPPARRCPETAGAQQCPLRACRCPPL